MRAFFEINRRLVYGIVSGYGNAEAWRDRPGQDLLAQARSGIMWLSGNEGDPPTPMALAIADMLAGHSLCEGILACLVRRGVTWPRWIGRNQPDRGACWTSSSKCSQRT